MNELPLLHGIPMSIKDMFWQKGFLATVGCAFLCKDSDRATEDGVIVSLFIKSGAIPLVRGNCPQSALSLHTDNLIFGCTRNPHDQCRSAGGSSGGDAALIASQCVPFSIGTDIGGSLRFPAAFCGIYGFKPTQTRLTKKGIAPARSLRFSHFTHLTGTIGPMGKSVSDLVTCIKVLCDAEINKLDPFAAPCPWRD